MNSMVHVPYGTMMLIVLVLFFFVFICIVCYVSVPVYLVLRVQS